MMQARGDRWGVCSTYRGRNIRSGGLGFRRGLCQFGVARVAQNFVISKEAGFELTVENGGGYGPPQPLKLRLMTLARVVAAQRYRGYSQRRSAWLLGSPRSQRAWAFCAQVGASESHQSGRGV